MPRIMLPRDVCGKWEVKFNWRIFLAAPDGCRLLLEIEHLYIYLSAIACSRKLNVLNVDLLRVRAGMCDRSLLLLLAFLFAALTILPGAPPLQHPHRYALALPTLTVPTALTTTVGRPWLVPFMTLPVWARWAAFFPALMSTVLLFMDQNITVRLVNSKQHKLKKG